MVFAAVVQLLVAIVACIPGVGSAGAAAGTTTASAANFNYDAQTVARVDAHAFGAADASPAQLSVAQEESASPAVESRGTSTTPDRDSVATNTAPNYANWGDEISDGLRMVDQPIRPPGYGYATTPQKLDHIFVPKHNLDPLVTQFGSREAVVEQLLFGIRGRTPPGGVFEVPTTIGGQIVVVRGAVLDGIPRLGTAFTPP